MIKNFQLFNHAITSIRNYIESWLIVLRFLVSFKSNEDFDMLRPDRKNLPETDHPQSSGRIRLHDPKRRNSSLARERRAGSNLLKKAHTGPDAAVSNRVSRPGQTEKAWNGKPDSSERQPRPGSSSPTPITRNCPQGSLFSRR